MVVEKRCHPIYQHNNFKLKISPVLLIYFSSELINRRLLKALYAPSQNLYKPNIVGVFFHHKVPSKYSFFCTMYIMLYGFLIGG